MKVITYLFLCISSISADENLFSRWDINFGVGAVKTIVITFLDVRSECEFEYLLYGGTYGCVEEKYLKAELENLIVRKIITIITNELNIKLVEMKEVNEFIKRIIEEKGGDYIQFLKRTGLSVEEVKYMVWERLNATRYLHLIFGEKFSLESEEFKNWKKEMMEKMEVREFWDSSVSNVRKLLQNDN